MAKLAVGLGAAALVIALGGVALSAHAGKSGGSGKIVGYAHVRADGTVDAARSRNVTGANVRPQTGWYCFKRLPFEFKGIQATMDWQDSNSFDTVSAMKGDDVCDGHADAEVHPYNTHASLESGAFYVVFYR